MKSRKHAAAMLSILPGFGLLAVAGEQSPPEQARFHTTSPTVLYTLGAQSSYVEGCWGLCKCPIRLAPQFGGTFRLELLPANALSFTSYAVTDVDWSLTWQGEEIPITGSGSYQVGMIDGMSFHQLVLILRFGDDPEPDDAVFDSGLVPSGGSGDFPDLDISINQYNLQCYDTVIHIAAAGPAEPRERPVRRSNR